ncbi:mediator of RNA polymerase II transcription subunit 6-like [Schistocerca gregaria]|uniref:mediator of RNA polymerase II transcription subunit 6-like n=1 Tax=Schistocerca gregaria TaxID=7010 RepID=UPI00211EDD1C|nr:mediator of RNA polymerase II transcription subunit 6-like [Schistocerca gregaria]
MSEKLKELIPPEEDLTGISAHDLMFPYPLTEENVLDYFASTKFFDSSCNNQVIKMQRLSNDVLKHMVGVEYAVDGRDFVVDPKTNVAHELWKIKKKYRESPEKETIIAVYYIIDRIIYQAPDDLSVCEARLTRSVDRIQHTFIDTFNSIQFNSEMYHVWKPDITQLESTSKFKPMHSSQLEQMNRLIPLLKKKFLGGSAEK